MIEKNKYPIKRQLFIFEFMFGKIKENRKNKIEANPYNIRPVNADLKYKC